MPYENTYWSENGKHQDLLDPLYDLIPAEGEVDKPHANPALERFRKASNAYYDLYNNGLGNRARSFSKIFGICLADYRDPYDRFEYADSMFDLTEKRMDDIIILAAAEQNIIK